LESGCSSCAFLVEVGAAEGWACAFDCLTVCLLEIPQSQKLPCAANTSHSKEVADFQPESGDNLLIFLRTSNTGVDHHAS